MSTCQLFVLTGHNVTKSICEFSLKSALETIFVLQKYSGHAHIINFTTCPHSLPAMVSLITEINVKNSSKLLPRVFCPYQTYYITERTPIIDEFGTVNVIIIARTTPADKVAEHLYLFKPSKIIKVTTGTPALRQRSPTQPIVEQMNIETNTTPMLQKPLSMPLIASYTFKEERIVSNTKTELPCRIRISKKLLKRTNLTYEKHWKVTKKLHVKDNLAR